MCIDRLCVLKLFMVIQVIVVCFLGTFVSADDVLLFIDRCQYFEIFCLCMCYMKFYLMVLCSLHSNFCFYHLLQESVLFRMFLCNILIY